LHLAQKLLSKLLDLFAAKGFFVVWKGQRQVSTALKKSKEKKNRTAPKWTTWMVFSF